MKVFVVDDSNEVRQRLITMLSDIQGIEMVGQAEGAVEATVRIREMKPDVVILDIQMPGMSGIDALKRIKKKEGGPLVIMLTNYPYPQYRQRCLEAGAEFFFDKSTEFHRVMEVLEQMVQGSGPSYRGHKSEHWRGEGEGGGEDGIFSHLRGG